MGSRDDFDALRLSTLEATWEGLEDSDTTPEDNPNPSPTHTAQYKADCTDTSMNGKNAEQEMTRIGAPSAGMPCA